jgi:hypothetical protein
VKAVWLTLGIMLIQFSAAPLRAQKQFDVFGGYSYFRASVTETGTLLCPPAGPPCPTKTVSANPNLNGWEGSVEYKLTDAVGVVADFSGHYGSLPTSLGSGSMHAYTYLFGPQISYPARISPFAHVLLGVAHESTASGSSNFFFPGHSSNAFTMGLGGGIDVRVFAADVRPTLWVRLIQVDYLASHFPSNLQNQARISAGVVFRF